MKWYDNKRKVIVLLILFFPLGFYGLWASEKFSRSLRDFITIVLAFAAILWYGRYEKSKESNEYENRSSSVVFQR